MTAELADLFRYMYAVLATIAAMGFAATLVIRWDVLKRGERILRAGLIAEHAVAVYGAWVALQMDFPPTYVGLALTASLVVILVGFAIWLVDDVLPGDLNPNRLTDRR